MFRVDDQNPSPPNLGDVLRDAVRPTVEILLDLAAQLWWLWLIMAAVLLVQLISFVRQQRRLARSGIREIDLMDGPTFESYLATMFRRLGYDVEIVGSARGDYGGDLVIRKDGKGTVVQAKRYRDKKVGIKAVQEAHTARTMYDCADAMVVTNSGFSQQARKTARATGVRLWGRAELIAHLLTARNAPHPGDLARASCANCGVDVSEKVQAFCVANPGRFGGRVYCFRHQRAF